MMARTALEEIRDMTSVLVISVIPATERIAEAVARISDALGVDADDDDD